MSKELVKAALLGTNYYAINATSQEILLDIGISELQRRAGYIPAKSDFVIEASSLTRKKPLCDERTLNQFLNLYNSKLQILSLWVTRFAQEELRLPNELMPALLNSSKLNRHLIHAIYEDDFVWFMKQFYNSEWSPNKKGQSFEFSKDYFEELRKRDPQAACAELENQWETLSAWAKENFLSMMYHNLNEGDITFLIKVFKENKKNIRFQAANLLSLAHAEFIQSIVNKVLNGTYLAKNETPVFDFRWSGRFSELPIYMPQSRWYEHLDFEEYFPELYEYVRLVPMDAWCEYWQVSPETLLEAAYNGGNANFFFSEWQKRIIDEDNVEFAMAMVNFLKNKLPTKVKIDIISLLKLFPFAYLQDYVDQELQQ